MQRSNFNRFSFVFASTAIAMTIAIATTGPADAGDKIAAAVMPDANDQLTSCSPYNLAFRNEYTSGGMVLALSRSANGYAGEISSFSSGSGAASANGPVTDLTVRPDQITFNATSGDAYALQPQEGCGLSGTMKTRDPRVGTIWSNISGHGKATN